MDKLIINFTPTGMVPSRDITPHVPIQPNEIIEQVQEACQLGITLVHLHARKEDGVPEYRKNVYRNIIEGIKKYCPDLVLCVSLSGRYYTSFEQRSEALELKPDMGSLTLSSMNFNNQASINTPEMISGLVMKMIEYGVNPELECFDSGMINYSKYLIEKGLVEAPYYYNILLGGMFSAQLDPGQIDSMIKALPDNSYWSLAGLGFYQLRANAISIALGGGVRVGIEDNIWYDQGKKVKARNIDLLKRIHLLAEIMEREVMSPSFFGKLGFYNKNRDINA